MHNDGGRRTIVILLTAETLFLHFLMINHLLQSTLGRFRLVALSEGISYLFLLCIAMPLKYAAGYPMAVRYSGWLHGVLFVLYMLLLLQVWRQYRWKFGKVLWAFAASLIPFGGFVLDHQLKKQAA
jgi:integral membrane protein